jgi:hypothetical protein
MHHRDPFWYYFAAEPLILGVSRLTWGSLLEIRGARDMEADMNDGAITIQHVMKLCGAVDLRADGAPEP